MAMMCSEDAKMRIRAAGLRLTPQRRAVIDALCGDTTHPAAEDVASRVESTMPGVSLSTVYNTLHELAGIGLVREVDARGAMRFDPDTSPHAHLVCDGCGSLSDVPLSSPVLAQIAASVDGVAVSRVDVTIHCSCETCSAG